MMARSRLPAAVLFAGIALACGVVSAWPIYDTPWLIAQAVAGLIVGGGAAILAPALARRWSVPVAAVVLIIGFGITVVPVAMPGTLARLVTTPVSSLLPAIVSALGDGLSAIVLGWKQLLTLTVPVGSYETVLVPAYVVFAATAFLVIVLRTTRLAPFASAALLAPVLFGTVFGSAQVSDAWPLLVVDRAVPPRELGLWLVAAAIGAAWVAWVTSAEHRAALRRLTPNRRMTPGSNLVRTALAVVVLLCAGVVSVLVNPLAGADQTGRQMLRETVEPDIVLNDEPSPLAAYRAYKQNDLIDTALFEVTADGELPPRLRLAVLDRYDGRDFHVGTAAGPSGADFGFQGTGEFTRFPSAPTLSKPSDVTVEIGEGYHDIWMPTAALGSLPAFTGPRADALADGFYVDRHSSAAIVVTPSAETGARGLTAGDGFRVRMSAREAHELSGRPAVDGPQFDLDAMPELEAWVDLQGQPADASGLAELIERLRARGYLSHGVSDDAAQQLWLSRLTERYGTRFWPSPGGHSRARIEELFGQLNTQEQNALAHDSGSTAALVAAVGDDEQFAVASALVARALGFDSRVILGVRLGDDDTVQGVPNCVRTCTGENLAAWIEVRGADGQWVPMDTTPQLLQPPTSLDEDEQLPEFDTTPHDRNAQEVDPPVGVGDPADDTEDPTPPTEPGWWIPVLRIVGLSLTALLLLVIPLCFLPLAKRFRRRRRRRASPAELAAVGAWIEVCDAALELLPNQSYSQLRRTAGSTLERGSRREIAGAFERALSSSKETGQWAAILTERLAIAAKVVDHAVFSPEGLREADVARLWAEIEDDLSRVRSLLGWWQRIRAAYSLRSVVRWPALPLAVLRPGAEESRLETDESEPPARGGIR